MYFLSQNQCESNFEGRKNIYFFENQKKNVPLQKFRWRGSSDG
jgi:hypothetical protein